MLEGGWSAASTYLASVPQVLVLTNHELELVFSS